MKFSVIVPTYNAGYLWEEWIKAYNQQTLRADKVIVIDSCSTDQTAVLAEQAGFFVQKIAKAEFNHGDTRNLATQYVSMDTDILVFLTQDALLADRQALANLINNFENPEIAAVCGRQLPHLDANLLATHARLFNYPDKSVIKSKNDINSLGLKTVFMSNSFAAYRKSIFDKLGGFPQDTILAEDMYLTAKIINADYKVVYCAEAQVYHSHNYSLIQEFQRYFDTGVFQQKHAWIQSQFGKANNEGKKFVISELKFLLKNNFILIPMSLLSILFKFSGFKLGFIWNKLPIWLVRKLSMHKGYWK
ncbi:MULTISPECIES: glycosyltransferase family 2 protein [Glaesserella]|uniref:Rhamnosyltransferase n=1 Tax=Glaesserella australis TaxID=2094024 RepID=A0A328BVN0_9PAST|nr:MULTISPECIES: glycosyltransferase [Glaesserella]AUI67108.1 rhamnosyltransferase [Glaesserella sp. 15-184]RAL18149.1 rhamnosyltransferase [Glaesserella australis]